MGHRRSSASSNPLGCFFLLALGLIVYIIKKIGSFINSIPAPLLVVLLGGFTALIVFIIYKKRHPNDSSNEKSDFWSNPSSSNRATPASHFIETENTLTDPVEQIPAFGSEPQQESINPTLKKNLKKKMVLTKKLKKKMFLKRWKLLKKYLNQLKLKML